MVRKHWRNPRFWPWWWRNRASLEAKGIAVVAAVLALGAGGYVGSRALGDALAAGPTDGEVQVLTIQRLVTVRRNGRAVTRPVRVLRRVAGRATTAYVTQTVRRARRAPARTRVVTAARVVTASRVVTATRGATVTNQRVVTSQRVVTDQRVVTSERVVTATQPGGTTTRVVTDTRTITTTVPVTTTVVQTVTEPVTVTVTLPPGKTR